MKARLFRTCTVEQHQHGMKLQVSQSASILEADLIIASHKYKASKRPACKNLELFTTSKR